MKLQNMHNTPQDTAWTSKPDMVGMELYWLASDQTTGAKNVLFSTAVFPPKIQHALHRHPHAEEVCYIVKGHGYHIHEGGLVAQGEGDLTYIPVNEWHGFYNPTDEPVVMVSAWGGVANILEAGYEEMPDSLEIVKKMVMGIVGE